MFGTGNISPDYTFTQSETRFFKTQSAKAISNYFGNSGVSKNDDENKTTDEDSPIAEKKDLDKLDQTDPLEKKHAEKIKAGKKKDETIHLLGQKEDDEDSNDELFHTGDDTITITNSFDSLAVAVGAVGGKISKQQLLAYLQSLTSSAGKGPKSEAVAFVKNLIAQFDSLSGGSDYITSLTGIKEAQDYTTITKDQVTPPIDIRV